MSYIDGFVAPVPTANKAAYVEHARIAATVFKEAGALEVMECWAEDTPEGQWTSFPRAVQLKPDETVAFGWIVWPSKAVRDAGMQKAMVDPRMKPETNPMPFDGKRLVYGGFAELMRV
ncbi:MAG TPA: DUF1428 domain-containing protein [Ramlibacter sp.]|nr:DUF1428 domain-containing protein [Ramlibacter sp.]